MPHLLPSPKCLSLVAYYNTISATVTNPRTFFPPGAYVSNGHFLFQGNDAQCSLHIIICTVSLLHSAVAVHTHIRSVWFPPSVPLLLGLLLFGKPVGLFLLGPWRVFFCYWYRFSVDLPIGRFSLFDWLPMRATRSLFCVLPPTRPHWRAPRCRLSGVSASAACPPDHTNA